MPPLADDSPILVGPPGALEAQPTTRGDPAGPVELSPAEYVPVRLVSFPVDRPPLVDLYHPVDGQFVLYCSARAVLSTASRRELVDNGVTYLYYRVGGSEGEGTSLSSVLNASEDELASSTKALLLYDLTVSSTSVVFKSTTPSERVHLAQNVVGTIVSGLVDNPNALRILTGVMRHDSSLYTHAVNVCHYAVALGLAIGLDRESIRSLSLAAFLHDIAKAHIPRSILDKPSGLSEKEWAVMRRHPEIGARLVGPEVFDVLTLQAIRQHHERLDGSGYPFRLKGPQVKLLSRIVGLVDVYDVLTSDRPKQAALSPYAALVKMRDDMAGHFDLDLYVAFVRILGSAVKG